ncbi:pentapeptide repeat-containing protein [Streptomyces sp. NPDC048192]|uniref:pentapeptide repeat-containing protein n=1 Tax=Streptomyces sp. NPDC048192 TaxID=3365510 RepID=UPI00371B860F
MSTPSPPSWLYCGHGADPATDPVGCTGIHVPGHTACLAHLADTDRTAYLTGLAPGADIDHRGTPFTHDLLEALLNALQDPTTNAPHIGTANFEQARFLGVAWFARTLFSGFATFDGAQFSDTAAFDLAQFSGPASFEQAHFSDTATFEQAHFFSAARFGKARFFDSAMFERTQFSDIAGFGQAQFSGPAEFEQAQFSGPARFLRAQFSGTAWFKWARFSGPAQFDGAQFSGPATFEQAQFSDTATFEQARFSGTAQFDGAQFSGPATFDRARFSGTAGFGGGRFSATVTFGEARFEGESVLGPFVCARMVRLSGAVFMLPVTLEVAARAVMCKRTRWESTATLRVRYATVDLSHAVLTAPAAVITHPTPFTHNDLVVSEDHLATPGVQPSVTERVRVVSVQGVDAAHLVLTDTDLTDCLFSGAFHLDQIRLEGRTTFADAPTGWHRRGIRPVRFSPRRVLAEEHHWRAHTAGQPVPPAGAAPDPRLWHPGPHHPDPARTPDPEDVAALYRQLRKAFEDGKNEPGAADFYYGECEMRRHDLTGTTKGERRLLWGYWLLSGYGLRASRAFTWLLAAMSLTVLLLVGFGLPTHDPDPATTGTLTGSKISLHTSTPDPTLHGGWTQRMTWDRAEKATRVAINSVVFRSSGQNLTTPGTYIEMTSRLLEPTLLALGVLAIRGRIKR